MLNLCRRLTKQNVKHVLLKGNFQKSASKCVHISSFHNIRMKNDNVNGKLSSLFKPVNVTSPNDYNNVGAELVGKLDRNDLVKTLNKFSQLPEIKALCLENGLDGKL